MEPDDGPYGDGFQHLFVPDPLRRRRTRRQLARFLFAAHELTCLASQLRGCGAAGLWCRTPRLRLCPSPS